MSATTPQSHPSFEELFKHVDTVPLALFEHLDLSFLEEFPVFAPNPWGRTREHEAPELFKGVLYCFSRDIYGVKDVARELQDELVWRQCGYESAPSYQSVHRFFTDFALVAEDAFGKLVEQVADRDLLDNTFRIDSTDVQADPDDDDATWNYDPTAEADDTENEDDSDMVLGDGIGLGTAGVEADRVADTLCRRLLHTRAGERWGMNVPVRTGDTLIIV